jgi:hypothetical protein
MKLSKLINALICAQEKLNDGHDPEVVFQEGIYPNVSGIYNFDSVLVEMNVGQWSDKDRVMIVQE